MKTDPLQQAPDFDITPQDLLRETLALLESSRNIRDHITGSITPSKAIFENVIIPLAEDENNTADRLKTFVFLGSVSTEPNLREASRQAEKLIARSEAEFLTREDVFKLIDSVFEKHQNLRTEGRAELDAESGYLLQRKHQEYLQNGLRIPAGPQRERFMTARAELDDLLTAARKSLSEVDDGIWFLRKDLVGVPDTSLATMEESKEDPNKIWVTFRKPHFIAIMQNCANSITRKRMWVAKENRFLDNVDRLKKIIVLRDEIARLLGFTNHAELKMTEKMARSVERVLTELMQLRTKLAPLAQIEIERASELKMRDLASRKTESSHGDASKLHLWDWSFYDRMLKNENYSFNSAIVAEYFEVMHTMKQMLGIFEQLFGMRFEEVQDDAWEKDVIIFTVWNDESGGSCFLGRLYLDLFLRKGKYDGASHHMIQPVSSLLTSTSSKQYLLDLYNHTLTSQSGLYGHTWYPPFPIISAHL
jgi:metallopeptidase MepB